jgi:hypothetical protein
MKKMSKINFTKEHFSQMKEIFADLSISGETLDGGMGANKLSPWDLLHTTSINGLQKILLNIRKNITSKESLDSWSMTDYQQRQISLLKKWEEFIHLLIGYKKSQAERYENSTRARELRAKMEELRRSTMTPEEQLKEIEEQIKELES